MSQSGYTPILIYASGTATNLPLAADLTSGASGAELALNYADGKLYYKSNAGVVTLIASSAGSSGDVVGPASATDNALARFDLTTGKLIQNSVGILSDAGVLTGLTGITSSGSITLSSLTSGRVTFAGASGLLTDSANLTFNGTILTSTGFAGPLDGTVGAITPAAGTFTSLSDSGNLTFTGTGNRITGDFSHATLSNRVSFQTSTTNGNTVVGVLPNGTSNTASYDVFNTSDPTNSVRARFGVTSTSLSIESSISGTGTYVPMTFYTGGGERIRIDTSGNVGIGTSSPGTKLQAIGIVKSGGTGTNGEFNLARTSDGLSVGKISLTESTQILDYNNLLGSGVHTFTINSAERMRIDSSGNVGIGTTTPSTYGKLAVSGNIYAGDTTSTADGTITIGSGGAGSVAITRTGTGATNSAMTFSTTFSTLQERMRIDSSGNVGIGTASPTGRLHVRWDAGAGDGYTGKSIFSTTDQALFIKTYWQSGTGQHTTLEASNLANSALTDLRSNGATLQFLTGSTERMRIDSSGNLLVGTTSVIGGSNAIGQFLNVNGGRPGIVVGNSVGSSATNAIIFVNSNGTVGSIQTSASATSYNTSSDYRLKNTIAPMTGALDKVALLKPCTYKWNVDGSDGQGFIAHELQEVVEGCVTGEKDAVDDEGKPRYQGVDTSFLVATLTAAIQELKAIIDTQAERITALEQKA